MKTTKKQFLAEIYKLIGSIITIISSIFFFDAIINIQLLNNILIKNETITKKILGEINPSNLLIILVLTFFFIIIGIITIIRGILIQYNIKNTDNHDSSKKNQTTN